MDHKHLRLKIWRHCPFITVGKMKTCLPFFLKIKFAHCRGGGGTDEHRLLSKELVANNYNGKVKLHTWRRS